MTKTNGHHEQQAIEERRRYAIGFNATMIKIWQEQIDLLGIHHSGGLRRSLSSLPLRINEDASEFEISHRFIGYGIYVDWGVGKEIPKGNPGDIGREKKRRRKQWFSKKYYSSVRNLTDYMQQSIGKEFVGAMTDGLDNENLKTKLI